MNERELDRDAVSAAASASVSVPVPVPLPDSVPASTAAGAGASAPRPASGRSPTPAGVGLDSWRDAPHNRRAFHHVAELVPVATVRRGTDVAALEASDRDLAAFDLQIPDGPRLGLDAVIAATSTDALVVLLDGRVVHESYGNGMDPGSRHILMSATKAVMGLLAELLASTGVLDVEAPVARYVPEVGGGPYAGATVRHLLDMRAAIRFDATRQSAYDEATGWQPSRSGTSSPGLHAFFAQLTGEAEAHGGPFRYVSANTDLLGWVIERAAAEPVPSLLGRLLWAPLGTEQDADLTLDPAGAPRCTGGFCATARDFARLGRLVVDAGRCGGVQVVPSAAIDDLAGGDRSAWAAGEWGAAFAPISRSMCFRSGWYTTDGPPQTLFAMGVYGQNLFVDRANRIVVAKFSSWAQPTDYRALGLTHPALGEIRRCLVDPVAARS